MLNKIAYTTYLNRMVSMRNLCKLGINIVEHKMDLRPCRGSKACVMFLCFIFCRT